MARGINKVILIGNLGADPDVRYSAAGTPACTVSVATNESWKDKQTGELQERTEWHRVKFFGKLAEIAGEYLKKGQQVYIEGSIRSSKYTDKDGIERWSTDIIANVMQMLGGGASEGAAPAQAPAQNRGQQPSGRQQAPAQSQPQRARGRSFPGAGQAPAQEPAPAMAGGDGGYEDDDIPF
ncbi:MAG: single-stranded DNA-binding protein [Rhodanobacteraceae bacterium]|nr:MAG: single-stranded DNA-binding protein [Rhodanobacteraceae bacterium]